MKADKIVHPVAGIDAPILVFGFPALGDAIVCQSLVRLIAQRYPGRPIDMVLRQTAVGITPFMPEVRDGIVENFRHYRLDLAGRLTLAKDLRRRGYAAAYIIQNSFKSALVPFLAGIPERIGWSREFRRPLLTKPRFGVRRFRRLVDECCWLFPDSQDDAPAHWPAPRLAVPASLRARFDVIAQKAHSMAPVVVMAPGSGAAFKNWPVENFAVVARHCVQAGCAVWVVGASAHRRLADEIGKAAPVQDCMTESLAELVLAIAAADIYVGNDTGPLHIAAAFGKPCLAVYGHRDIEQHGPVNPGVHIVIPELSRPQGFGSELQWPSAARVIYHLDRIIAAVKRGGESGRTALQPTGDADVVTASGEGDLTVHT